MRTHVERNDEMHKKESDYGKVKVRGPAYHPASSNDMCITIDDVDADSDMDAVPRLVGGYDFGEAKNEGGGRKGVLQETRLMVMK